MSGARGRVVLPWSLLTVRVALGPLLFGLTWRGTHGWWLAAIIALHTGLDIADGMTARRLGVATPRLRRADSAVDTWFYLWTLAAIVRRAPTVLSAHPWLLGGLLASEAARHLLDQSKFGWSAAYHMWSAKLWGVALFAGCAEALVTAVPGPLFATALVLGLVTNTEGFAASLVLHDWEHDVPSVWHARVLARRRAAMRGDAPDEPA